MTAICWVFLANVEGKTKALARMEAEILFIAPQSYGLEEIPPASE